MSFSSIFSIIMGVMSGLSILMAIFLIIMFFANSILLESKGEKCWTQIIPFYGTYIRFRTFWDTRVFPIYLLCIFIPIICSIITAVFTILNVTAGLVVMSLITTVAVIISFIGIFVIAVILFNYHLAKSFGKGIGFTIGLILLGPIFLIILVIEQLKQGIWSAIPTGRKVFMFIIAILMILSAIGNTVIFTLISKVQANLSNINEMIPMEETMTEPNVPMNIDEIAYNNDKSNSIPDDIAEKMNRPKETIKEVDPRKEFYMDKIKLDIMERYSNNEELASDLGLNIEDYSDEEALYEDAVIKAFKDFKKNSVNQFSEYDLEELKGAIESLGLDINTTGTKEEILDDLLYVMLASQYGQMETEEETTPKKKVEEKPYDEALEEFVDIINRDKITTIEIIENGQAIEDYGYTSKDKDEVIKYLDRFYSDIKDEYEFKKNKILDNTLSIEIIKKEVPETETEQIEETQEEIVAEEETIKETEEVKTKKIIEKPADIITEKKLSKSRLIKTIESHPELTFKLKGEELPHTDDVLDALNDIIDKKDIKTATSWVLYERADYFAIDCEYSDPEIE